ncbi:MAG TPA: 30S ribosome-binding factor RbfA [Blastocatellia bacterium]|nr:30S ribosome-binding factor RbfA [Blastocatellia bacterium]
MAGRRAERLAEQLREEVSMIIAGEVEDPRVADATVTEVRLSPDLRYAKIYVSVMGTDEEIKESVAALNHAARFIRRQLAAALRLRYTPELHFVFDQTSVTAARIEELLSEEVEKAREREQDR